MLPYEDRAAKYARLIARNKSVSVGNSLFDSLESVESFYGTAAKRAAFQRIEAAKWEGVVFKTPRYGVRARPPQQRGTSLEFKFRESSTVICLGESRDGKRSIRLGLLNGAGEMVNVGMVREADNEVQ